MTSTRRAAAVTAALMILAPTAYAASAGPAAATPTSATPVAATLATSAASAHLLAAAGPAASAAPARARHVNVGVVVPALRPGMTPAKENRLLDKLQGMGVTETRATVQWSVLQPNGPRFDRTAVAKLDQFVNQVRRHGMHLLMDPLHVPSWANGGRGSNIAPTRPSRYYHLTKWLVNRYYPTVNGVEAWNEPNLPIDWSSSVANYVDVVRAGCRGTKAAHPDVYFVTGGVASNDVPWVHKFYLAGGGDVACWDYFGMHPYPKYHSPLKRSPSNVPDVQRHYFPTIDQVHRMMLNNDDHRKVFITEVGWSTHGNKGITNPFHWGVTQAKQSKFFQQAIHRVNTQMPWVAGFNLYTAANTPYSGNTTNNRYFGLMTLQLEPKLVCATLRQYLSQPTTP